MDVYKLQWQTRSAADWLTEADHFDRMAGRFQRNKELSEGFRKLAADARRRSAQARC